MDETPMPRVFRMVFLAALLMCASFAAAASGLLLLTYALHGASQPDSTLIKLVAKTVFFLFASCATGLAIWKSRHEIRPPLPATAAPPSAKELVALLAILLLIALEITPHLAQYPWAAPDETYHMTVARNLAVHGLYASGDPAAGFTMFDPYDSVGAPVIVPIAGALKLAGVNALPHSILAATRAVMLAYYFVLCAALFLLARATLGPAGALTGLLLMTASFGSTYLARTLYGEVPALAFLATGLLAWRRGIASRSLSGWLPIAGVLFGMSVLCKSIMILTAFAFLGALAYDAVTFRRTRWSHYLIPGICGLAVITAWWALQASLRHGAPAEDGGTLGLYQHYLMFGYRSAGHAIAWMLQDPLALIGLISGMALVVPIIFHKRYDPALVVLFLTAIFFAFWWVFFTPAQIPRYVWFSYAIAALFAGNALWNAARCIGNLPPSTQNPSTRAIPPLKGGRGDVVPSQMEILAAPPTSPLPPFKGGMCIEIAPGESRNTSRRIVSLLLAVVILIPAGQRVFREFSAVYTLDEMHDDRELALLVRDLPESSRVATTYWPLARTLNVLAGRHVETIDKLPERVEPGCVIITDNKTQPEAARGREPSTRMGRYAIFTASP